MAIELYSHNKETYDKVVEMFNARNRVGIVQPTGTGKSFIFLKWIEDNTQDRFVIDGVIMLRPTTSPIIYLQQMGRALAVGNEHPLVFDMVNNYHNVQVTLKNGEKAGRCRTV